MNTQRKYGKAGVVYSHRMYAVCFYWRAYTFEPGMDFASRRPGRSLSGVLRWPASLCR